MTVNGTVPSRVGILGDIHGSLRVMEQAFIAARKVGVDTIIQLGDFWIYDNPREVAKLVRRARVFGVSSVLFLDGNHEAYSFFGGKHSVPGFHSIAGGDGILHLLGRGSIIAFHRTQVKALVLGGAVSTDRFLTGTDRAGRRIKPRVEGKDWFPEEAITAEQAEYAASVAGDCTVLLSHDAPNAVVAAHDLTRGSDIHPVSAADDAASRANLDIAWNALSSPKFSVHGHFDTDAHSVTAQGDSLHSLSDGSLLVFDAVDLKVTKAK